MLRDVSLAVDAGRVRRDRRPERRRQDNAAPHPARARAAAGGNGIALRRARRPPAPALPHRLPRPAFAAGDPVAGDGGGGRGRGARRAARPLRRPGRPRPRARRDIHRARGPRRASVGARCHAVRRPAAACVHREGTRRRARPARARRADGRRGRRRAGVIGGAARRAARGARHVHPLRLPRVRGRRAVRRAARCSCAGASSSTGRRRPCPASGTTLPMSILDADFMRLAFAAGAIVGVLAPAVGFFLVQRGMSLIGDGIGHVAFAGVALGYLLGISPVGTALVASVLGAVSIEWLRSRRQAAGDQALALLFYSGIAAGVRVHLRRRGAEREPLLVSLRLDPHGDGPRSAARGRARRRRADGDRRALPRARRRCARRGRRTRERRSGRRAQRHARRGCRR